MFGKNKILGPDNRKELGVVNIFFTIQGEGIFAGMPAIFIRLGGCNLACKFCDTEFDDFEYMDIEKIIDKCFDKIRNQIFKTTNLQTSTNSKSSIHGNDYIEDKSEVTLEQNQYNQKIESQNNIIKSKKYLAVITGGEPFRQNISPLCDKLIENGFLVQIETNGLLWRDVDPKVIIVCSPKVIVKNTKEFEISSKKNQEEAYKKPLTTVDDFDSVNKKTNNGLKNTHNQDDYAKNFIYPKPHPILWNRIKNLKILISSYQLGYGDIPDWLSNDTSGFEVLLQPIDEYDIEKNQKNLELAISLAYKYNYKLSLQLHKIINVE